MVTSSILRLDSDRERAVPLVSIVRHPYGLRPMLESFQRTVIIGNCGSGKSVFAEHLAALTHIPAIDIDSLHWERGGHKRDEESAKRLVREAAATPRWIIEGVFGWLAEIALPRATAIIWLDLPWSVCREGLLARGQRGGSEADFAELLAWSEAYWDRKTSSSFEGHSRLFESFPGIKLRLRDRGEVGRLLTIIV